jgi:hypothetical protein
MMPVIRIPDPVFHRLQAFATPLVDTPATVIEKLLDFYESHRKSQEAATRVHVPPVPPSYNESDFTQFDPDNPPDLTHTRVISAEFDGQPAKDWNNLVRVAHRRAMRRVRSFDALCSASASNLTKGRRSHSGFQYVPDIDVSIQNVESNRAWQNTLQLARKLGCSLQIKFEWRHNGQAAFPGKRAVLSWKRD